MADTTETPTRAGSGRLLEARPRLRSALLSLCCLVLGAAVFLVSLGWDLEQWAEELPLPLVLLLPLDVLLGIAASLAVAPLRRSRAGALAIVVVSAVSTWALPAGIVSVVRLGTRRSRALDVLVIVVSATSAVGYLWWREAIVGRTPTDLPLVGAVAAAAAAVMLLWGRIRGTREALVVALRERASAADLARRSAVATRDAEISATRAEERSAIARDMHDGISHQLAIVAMHAGALEYRTDLSPAQQRSAAGTVRRAAADASGMLRHALLALRDPTETRPTIPQPDSAAIDAVLAAARQEGQQVDVAFTTLTAADLDSSPGRAATCVRILEELLMNARKHAPGAAVSLSLRPSGSGVALRVSNPITTAVGLGTGTGLGLVGVVERAELVGGSASYGTTSAGTFDVVVTLP